MTEPESTGSRPGPDDTAESLLGSGASSALDAIGDVQFRVVRRGYDREAVDAYVSRVYQLVVELSATRSPQGAVDRALERVGEETVSILQQAEETARLMTARAEARARERVQRAEREAQKWRTEAEVQVRRLDADIDRIWDERQRLIEDTRSLAEALLRVADDAEERFPPELTPSPGRPPAGEQSDDSEDSTVEVVPAAHKTDESQGQDHRPSQSPPS
jgi:DivIVA domain-containing protein